MLNFPLEASCQSSKSISGCRVHTEGFRSGKLNLAEWEQERRNLGIRKIFSLTQVFWTGASVRIVFERRPETDEELKLKAGKSSVCPEVTPGCGGQFQSDSTRTAGWSRWEAGPRGLLSIGGILVLLW